MLSLDFEAADARYQCEPSHDVTAERLFERDWASASSNRLSPASPLNGVAADKGQQFRVLSKYLVSTSAVPSYSAAAAELGMSEGAVKTAVHRLRAKFRERLCEQVETTLGNDELIEDEIRRLFAALSL